jgi:chromosome partitioning protein
LKVPNAISENDRSLALYNQPKGLAGGAMAAADFCLIPARPSPADIEAAAPTLAAVRESGKPFAFVLNQVQARSARLNGAAGSLGERAVALKMADVLALPAIVLRNDQQDALGVGLGVTEYAPRGKSAQEIRGLWQRIWARLNRVSPQAYDFARRGAAGGRANSFVRHRLDDTAKVSRPFDLSATA